MDGKPPRYIDEGLLREQDRVSMGQYLSRRDRAQLHGRGQAFFSGREREVNAFREVAHALRGGDHGNVTIAVEGPAGCGKSALLAQFQEELRTLPPPPGRRWLPVPMGGGGGESPAMIAASVNNAVARRLARDLLDAQDNDDGARMERLRGFLGEELVQRAGGALKDIARIGLERGFSAFGVRLGPPPSLRDEPLQEVASRNPEWSNWHVLVLIDEAQGITPAAPGAVPDTLSAIHQGFLPGISFCAFGLPGTFDALAAANVSRPTGGRAIELAGLDRRVATMVVRRCFAHFGVTHGAAWQAAILERSAGWPQHLVAYLCTALEEMSPHADAPESMGDARRSSLSAAIAAGDRERADHYKRRVASLNRDNPAHEGIAAGLVPLLRERGGAMPQRDLIAHLAAPPQSLPPQAITDFLRSAKYSGMLVDTGHGRVCMPIPTLGGYLLDEPPPLGNL